MDVYTFNHQKDLPIDPEAVQKLAQAVIAAEGQSFHEAAIHFVDVAAISSLHGRYFNDPTPTDCISFPMDTMNDEGYRVLGEVFVCPQVAAEYAALHGGDPFQEMSLYVVHGLLHLMGYDDMSSEDRARMRQAEERHMRNLAEQGLLLNS